MAILIWWMRGWRMRSWRLSPIIVIKRVMLINGDSIGLQPRVFKILR
jgi:hypothetical protein